MFLFMQSADRSAGTMALVVGMSVVLALPTSLVLLGVYRKRVVAMMSQRVTGPMPPQTHRADHSALDVHRPPLRVDTQPAAPNVPGYGQESSLLRDAVRASWLMGGVYAVGGAAFAGVMAYALITSDGVRPGVMDFLMVCWIFGWPALLAAAVVAAGTFRERAYLLSGYILVLAVLTVAATLSSAGKFTPIQSPQLWGLINAIPTALLLLFLNRRVRAVGPLVLVFWLCALGGAAAALDLLAVTPALQSSAATLGTVLGTSALLIVTVVALLGGAVVIPAGLAWGRWLGSRYQRKMISDTSISVDAIFFVCGIAQTLPMVAQHGVRWMLAGGGAFVAYKVTVRSCLHVVRRRRVKGRHAARLLVLRTFSLGLRSQRIFSSIATKWRHVGSIQLIAGPDLATATIEPHEFLDFIGGRLADRFIDSEAALERSVQAADLERDPDGRFRVNEFFCYDDLWRTTFLRLLSLSDVVLIDLRSFSDKHQGLTFELEEVVRSADLSRVVALVDDATDRRLLEETAQRAWRTAPPGVSLTGPNATLRLVQIDRLELTRQQEPLRSLCAVARNANTASAFAVTGLP